MTSTLGKIVLIILALTFSGASVKAEVQIFGWTTPGWYLIARTEVGSMIIDGPKSACFWNLQSNSRCVYATSESALRKAVKDLDD
jgi:hypothetical protein